MPLICLCALSTIVAASEKNDEITDTLDHIDNESFVHGAIEDWDAPWQVQFMASKKPELQYLILHFSEAGPQMIRRLQTPGALHYDDTRILYFIVFRLSKNPKVLPLIADYLDLPESRLPAPMVSWEHPFPYAIYAAQSFVDLTRFLAPFAQRNVIPSDVRHQMAEAVRAEYKSRCSEHRCDEH